MMRMELERELLSRPIRGLQYMLTRLALVHQELPIVAENGIFDDGTLEAVMRFQREFSPPVTGVVDRRTWDVLQKEWEKAEEVLVGPRPVRAFPGNGKRVLPGEWRDFLIVPQSMFQGLSHYFNGIVPAPADGLHGPVSADNVRWLQRAAQLETTGILDQSAWEYLSRLYEVFVLPEGILPDEIFPSWG